MEQLAITVVGGLAVLVIAKAFGLGGNAVKVFTVGRGGSSSKKWKWVILVAWLMLISGFYIFGLNNGHFDNLVTNNVYAMMGLDLMGLSVPVWIVGQVGAWLNS